MSNIKQQYKPNYLYGGLYDGSKINVLPSVQESNDDTSTPTAPTAPSQPVFDKSVYKPSDAVNNANESLNKLLAQKPGAYPSPWQAQLNDTIKKILNREDFSYDLNGDVLYQQYKDKYIQQGKLAMHDAIGRASAMTGGYGNSYAQSVGQQQYQASLDNLNDIVPELYQMAYDIYNQEGQDLYDQFAMFGEMENLEYGRHRDKVTDWLDEREYLQDLADAAYDRDYTQWKDRVDAANDIAQKEYENQYGAYLDDLEQWQKLYGTEGNKEPILPGNNTPTPEPVTQEEPKSYSDFSMDEYNKVTKENGGSSYYSQALSVLKEWKKAGKSNSEVSALLSEMVGNSYLLPSDYTRLYQKYRDNKL